MDPNDDHGPLNSLLDTNGTAGEVTAGQVRVLCPASNPTLPRPGWEPFSASTFLSALLPR